MIAVAPRALAPLLLMGVIFWLSAQPDLNTGLGVWDLLLRKGAHMAVFGVLALLWTWTLRPLTPLAFPIAVALTVLYAVSDEYHQSFVEGRHGSAVDVLIDVAGVALAGGLLRYHPRADRRRWLGGRERGTSLPDRG